MKNLLRTLLLTAILIAAIQAPTFAANTEPCEIVNETGQTILALYAVPIQRKDWGNDLVGNGVMVQGDRRLIRFTLGYNHYKIKAELEGGKVFTWKDVNLADTWRFSIRSDGTFDTNVRG